MPSSLDNFNLCFKMFTIMGYWKLNSLNPIKKQIYQIYQIFMLLFWVVSLTSSYMDLYNVRKNAEKISNNARITIGVTFAFLVNLELLRKQEAIDGLKAKFKNFIEGEKSADCRDIGLGICKQMKFLNGFFVTGINVMVLCWSVLSLYHGSVKLAEPFL